MYLAEIILARTFGCILIHADYSQVGVVCWFEYLVISYLKSSFIQNHFVLNIIA